MLTESHRSRIVASVIMFIISFLLTQRRLCRCLISWNVIFGQEACCTYYHCRENQGAMQLFLSLAHLVLLPDSVYHCYSTYSFLHLMEVNLQQFLGSLCVKTLRFSVIQLLLSRFITLGNKRNEFMKNAMAVQCVLQGTWLVCRLNCLQANPLLNVGNDWIKWRKSRAPCFVRHI